MLDINCHQIASMLTHMFIDFVDQSDDLYTDMCDRLQFIPHSILDVLVSL